MVFRVGKQGPITVVHTGKMIRSWCVTTSATGLLEVVDNPTQRLTPDPSVVSDGTVPLFFSSTLDLGQPPVFIDRRGGVCPRPGTELDSGPTSLVLEPPVRSPVLESRPSLWSSIFCRRFSLNGPSVVGTGGVEYIIRPPVFQSVLGGPNRDGTRGEQLTGTSRGRDETRSQRSRHIAPIINLK